MEIKSQKSSDPDEKDIHKWLQSSLEPVFLTEHMPKLPNSRLCGMQFFLLWDALGRPSPGVWAPEHMQNPSLATRAELIASEINDSDKNFVSDTT
mmetsp:Transcript_15043/g.26398  ORF Transcript_15043/g.26398 Transcript_15043/m.26398 type:complete len:95 (+) Transcript_15043:272-556(+)